MTLYLDEHILVEILFPFVSERYGRIEEVPDYRNDPTGMPKLLSVLDMVRNDMFYTSILDKAAYLLIGINKGHFFGNGNKRIALVITTIFMRINDKDLKDENKEYYEGLLSNLFPEQKTRVDYPEFSSTDYATYNLSLAIADSGALGIEHEDLKKRVLTFLTESTLDVVQEVSENNDLTE